MAQRAHRFYRLDRELSARTVEPSFGTSASFVDALDHVLTLREKPEQSRLNVFLKSTSLTARRNQT